MENNIEFDPNKNENVIAVIKEEDGNYRGYTQRYGKLITARQYDPIVVVQILLTADGTKTHLEG